MKSIAFYDTDIQGSSTTHEQSLVLVHGKTPSLSLPKCLTWGPRKQSIALGEGASLEKLMAEGAATPNWPHQ